MGDQNAKSAAHAELASMVAESSQSAVAARADVDAKSIGGWLAGAVPTLKSRRRLFENLGIPVDAWGPSTIDVENVKAIDSKPESLPTSTTNGPIANLDLRSTFQRLMSRLDDLEKRSREGRHVPVREAALIVAQQVAVAKQLARLSGESLSEAQILKAPAAKRVVEAIVGALRDFPEAAAAVHTVLVQLEQDGR